MSELHAGRGAAAWSLLASVLDPVAPPPGARARLLSALRDAPYLPFCRELAQAFDLEPGRMKDLLARIDDPERWTRGVAPLQGFFDFRPGPALSPLRGGFVRMLGGACVQQHRHRERELTFVLEGELVDGDGRVYRPGDVLDMPPGSSHTIRVPDGGRTLLALLHGRIEMLG